MSMPNALVDQRSGTSMKPGKQTTLRKRAILSGSGVHSNAPVRLVLHPSEANSGISFLRTGLPGGRERLIEAIWSNVSMTELCTVIGDPADASVSTVEHLLAAFAALGIDNVMVEIDGPEVPIMDGSSADFVEAIQQAGIHQLSAPRRYLKVLKPVRVEHGRAFSELRPADKGFRLEVEIDFAAGMIGRQKKVVDLDGPVFQRDIARARTFGFLRDVERLWKAGFALGASLENTVALDEERVLNPEGLRWPDEFVRHKTLDAVGDLALAGSPIIGAYRSFCGGHKMNVAVLAALFADKSAYEFIEVPMRREGPRADLRIAAQPAYAPERN
ncbi:MAG: UDP-3-O-[3-hydroxymyristoyl] N-acetylglucosamine deacetylase [Hyphomicrobiales bacterium]|nr:UDP-3-O-[3-hydroxymyristoyl] N-acetylglucosamine deacetylase [Hyphomicrobiales bacterium]